MRWVVGKLERAVPELDGVRAEDAQAVVSRQTLTLFKLWPLLALPLAFILLPELEQLVVRTGQRVIQRRPDSRAGDVARYVLQSQEARALGVGFMMVVPAVVVLAARDWSVRGRVRRLAGRAACPVCSGPLLGGARSAAGVWCRGCDAEVPYGVIGLGPRELGAPVTARVPTPWCHACSYPLQGVPATPGGTIVCPECGAEMWSTEERVL